MRGRLGIGEGAFGQPQSLIDLPEHPQREGVKGFRVLARIVAEPIGKIGMTCLIVELTVFWKCSWEPAKSPK